MRAQVLIPLDPSSATAPIGVLDLGQFFAQSKSAPKMPDSIEHIPANIREKYLYDEIQLTLTQAQVLFLPSLAALYGSGGDGKNPFLLEPFSSTITLFLNIGGDDPEIAGMKVDAVVKHTQINVSSSKLQQVLELGKVLSAPSKSADANVDTDDNNADGDEALVPTTTTTTTTASETATAFNPEPASADAPLQLIDYDAFGDGGRGIAQQSRRNVAAFKRQAFHDKYGWVDENFREVSRKVGLKATFKLESVAIAVSDDLSSDEDEMLLQFMLKGLYVDFTQRSFDKVIKLTLADLSIVDACQTRLSGGKGKQYMLSTRDVADSETDSGATLPDLVRVNVQMFEPLSDRYENAAADMIAKVELGSLVLVANRETAARMMDWSVQNFSKDSEDSDTTSSQPDSATRTQGASQSPAAAKSNKEKDDIHAANPFRSLHCNTLLHVTAGTIGVVLNTRRGPLCSMMLHDIHANIQQRVAMTAISARLGLFTVQDRTLAMDSPHRHIFGRFSDDKATRDTPAMSCQVNFAVTHDTQCLHANCLSVGA